MGTDCTSKCEPVGRAQEDWVGTRCIGEGAVVCASELQRVIKMDGFSLKCILNVNRGSVSVCMDVMGFFYFYPLHLN